MASCSSLKSQFFLLLAIVSTLLSLALPIALADGTGPGGQQYGYNPGSPTGPDRWWQMAAEWHLCGSGKYQSPIDLPLDQKHHMLGPLDFRYIRESKNATLGLDAHGYKMVVNSSWGVLEINDVKYYPDNVHFHAPSEHTIGNIRYPLEMHIVHKTANLKGIAVVGMLFKVGSTHNKFLDQFFKYIPEFKQKPEARIPIHSLTIKDLGIKLDSAYWRYKGSLTTPPCSEGVTWTVMKKVATISRSQLYSYRANRPIASNRPTQHLGSRKVTSFDLSKLCHT